jgi:hypothetical protein
VTPTRSSDARNIDPQARASITAAAADGPVISRWPVLARLPDVSREQGTRSEEQGARTEEEGTRRFSRDAQQSAACLGQRPSITGGGTGALPQPPAAASNIQHPASNIQHPVSGYRFDPPESFGPHMTADPTALAAAAASTGRSRTIIRTDRQGEPWPATRRARTSRPRTNVLPASNLFNVQGRGHASRLATVVQFLMLFALFTAAGSSLLMMQTAGLWKATTPEETPPAANQADIQPATAEPATVHERLDWDLPEPPTASRPHAESPPISKSAVEQAAAGDEPPAADESGALPYPTTAFPPTALPTGTQRLLPQIRTTDQPPAVARLPGYVLEAPIHQAHDDRNEPSLH